jgi:hypothetical protein
VLMMGVLVEEQEAHLQVQAVREVVMLMVEAAPCQMVCARSVEELAASCQSAEAALASCLYSMRLTMVSSPSMRRRWDSAVVDRQGRVVQAALQEALVPTRGVASVLSFAMSLDLRDMAHCPGPRLS